MNDSSSNKNAKLILWLKRIGIVGFLFFLMKGLAWIALGYFIFK